MNGAFDSVNQEHPMSKQEIKKIRKPMFAGSSFRLRSWYCWLHQIGWLLDLHQIGWLSDLMASIAMSLASSSGLMLRAACQCILELALLAGNRSDNFQYQGKHYPTYHSLNTLDEYYLDLYWSLLSGVVYLGGCWKSSIHKRKRRANVLLCEPLTPQPQRARSCSYS